MIVVPRWLVVVLLFWSRSRSWIRFVVAVRVQHYPIILGWLLRLLEASAPKDRSSFLLVLEWLRFRLWLWWRLAIQKGSWILDRRLRLGCTVWKGNVPKGKSAGCGIWRLREHAVSCLGAMPGGGPPALLSSRREPFLLSGVFL